MTRSEFRHDEQRAMEIVEALTGATTGKLEMPGGPDGTVDGDLTYADGRYGVIEVTTLADGEEFQLKKFIFARGRGLVAPGPRSWMATLSSPRGFDRFEAAWFDALSMMEQFLVDELSEIPALIVDVNPELAWLRDDSGIQFVALPNRGRSQGRPPRLYLSPEGGSAVWEDDGEVIFQDLAVALKTDLIERHIRKLSKHNDVERSVSERHLFLIVGQSGLSNASTIALMRPETAPSIDPELPDAVTHLWVASMLQNSVLLWSRGTGWTIHTSEMASSKSGASPSEIPRE